MYTNQNYTGMQGTIFVVFDSTMGSAASIPICSHCGAQTQDNLVNDEDRKPCCKRCALIRGAPKWLEAAFTAVGKGQASKLYRALATVFHPDTGGDERLMKALNTVKERHP